MIPSHSRPSGRHLAWQVLRRVRRDQAFSNLALSAALTKQRDLAAEERGLATELVYGVLRQQRLLDHALARHAQLPLKRLGPDVLDVLRIAAYQILMLDRVPSYAAVDHAVSAVRRLRGGKLAGVANAILRRLEPDDLELGLPEDPTERLAVECSLPDHLARHWVDQLGQDQTQKLARCLLERAPLTVRINSLRVDVDAIVRMVEQEGGSIRPGRWISSAFYLSGLNSPFETRSYQEGLWIAQDEAAQLVGHLVDPFPGQRVLDACAGVGGKSTHLGAMMQDRGKVVCVDVNAGKLGLLQQHCRRLGVTCCEPVVADLRHLGSLDAGAQFDRVLVDAPCSGLGVLRRHPELKWRKQGLETFSELVQLQRELLRTVVPLIRPGGHLIYSVCTTSDEEGPEQVRWLLAEFEYLTLLPVTEGPLANLVDPDGLVRLWPHRHGTDGFFMARLFRSSGV